MVPSQLGKGTPGQPSAWWAMAAQPRAGMASCGVGCPLGLTGQDGEGDQEGQFKRIPAPPVPLAAAPQPYCSAPPCLSFPRQRAGVQTPPHCPCFQSQRSGLALWVHTRVRTLLCVWVRILLTPSPPAIPLQQAVRRRLCTLQLRGNLINTLLIINNRLIAAAVC